MRKAFDHDNPYTLQPAGYKDYGFSESTKRPVWGRLAMKVREDGLCVFAKAGTLAPGDRSIEAVRE